MTVSKRRVRAIFRKELREYRRNRSLTVGMAIIPALFCVQPLVNGNHDTKIHTLADHISKTHIHQVGQFAYTDKFRYLQFIIIH